jgi:hypothetical protein
MRSLVPYFFISTHPVGWKCSLCGKIFRVPLNVLATPTTKSDDEIQARFDVHSCLAYRDELARKKNGAAGTGEPATDSEP